MAHFHPTDPTQRQRSAIRRSKVLTIKISNVSFTELSPNNIHQHKFKRNLDRRSPILIRHHQQQPTDVNDIHGNHLQLTLRNKSPRTSLVHSKMINENTIKQISKFSQSLQIPIWSPILIKKEIIPSRLLHSKSHSLKYYHTSPIERQNFIPNLFISSKLINNETEIFKKTNIKDLDDEWEDPKSNVAVLSDEDDSTITNCNNPQRFDHFIPSLTENFQLKTGNLQRRLYSFSLAPVVEDINDEIY